MTLKPTETSRIPAASRNAETASPGLPTLDNDLGFVLGVVFRAYVRSADAVFTDIPGGPRGYQVLAAATHHEAGSQRSLAQRLGVDRTVMTYLLDDLEEAGLVVRRPDPADRRSRHIVATPRGEERLSELESALRSVESQVLSALPSEGQASFRDQLQRVAAQLNELDPVGDPCRIVTDTQADVAGGKPPRGARGRKKR